MAERGGVGVIFIAEVFVFKTSGSPKTHPSSISFITWEFVRNSHSLNQTLGVGPTVCDLTRIPGEIDAC